MTQNTEGQAWWSWAAEEDEFQQHLAALVAWVAAHNNIFPDPFAAVEVDVGEEAHLASWVSSQRRMRAKKRMPQQRCEQLLAAFPTSWKWQTSDAEEDGAQGCAQELDAVLGARFKCGCGKTFNGAQQREQHRLGKRCPLNVVPALL